MADTSAHLADRVIPEVPVRQVVLSAPATTNQINRQRAGCRNGFAIRPKTSDIRTRRKTLQDFGHAEAFTVA